MKKFVILSLFAVLCLNIADAQRTTRKGLKMERKEVTDTSTVIHTSDTLKITDGMVEAYGYEKPLQSRHESFHAVNNTPYDIIELIAEIKYLDYKDRELHQRTVKIKCDIPPGATRLVTFGSWDKQNRFYFEKGPVPKRQAFQYHIDMVIKDAIIRAPEQEDER